MDAFICLHGIPFFSLFFLVLICIISCMFVSGMNGGRKNIWKDYEMYEESMKSVGSDMKKRDGAGPQ